MSIAANKSLFFLFLASFMAVTLLVARPLTSLAQSDYQDQEDCVEVTVRAEVGDNDNGGVEVEHRWVCSGGRDYRSNHLSNILADLFKGDDSSDDFETILENTSAGHLKIGPDP